VIGCAEGKSSTAKPEREASSLSSLMLTVELTGSSMKYSPNSTRPLTAPSRRDSLSAIALESSPAAPTSKFDKSTLPFTTFLR